MARDITCEYARDEITHMYSDRVECRINRLYGDCLEAEGVIIPNGGYGVCMSGIPLKVGDLVICGKITGDCRPCCKRVIKIDGDGVIVGTAYKDESRDVVFKAAEIYSVVLGIYDCKTGAPIWSRPL